jgi:hypothetical protein
MTPGTKSGGGAEKGKHSAENYKNSAENDEIKVPKKRAETGGNPIGMKNIIVTIFVIEILIIIFIKNQITLF